MMHLIRWLFRPVALIGVSALLIAAAAALVVYRPGGGAVKPQRPPLRAGDAEVAFIYPATNGTSWDRFVAAVRRSRNRLRASYPGLEVHENAAPGAAGSTATPEVILQWPSGRRLVFRWYKLTSEWTPELWMKELLRPPYPLAIIGGGNSTWARALALSLRDATPSLPEEVRPLLLITTATADRVGERVGDAGKSPDEVEPLTGFHDANGKYLPGIYEGHTYRFCFTNRQMASAVTHFIWTQPDLRPSGDPVYLVQWMDDSYSRDLFDGYARVLPRRTQEDLSSRAGWTAGAFAARSPLVALGAWWAPIIHHEAEGLPYSIPTSVGSFLAPNPYEAEIARQLLDNLRGCAEPESYRHLLVLTGQTQPSRRFLRELARSWPGAARRLVVASGDAISFNVVYRDRMITWPIQDLPFDLVFFCHRNPISVEAGFRAIDSPSPPGSKPSASSGTEDLLLFAEMVDSLALVHGEQGVANGKALAAGMDRLHWNEGDLTLRPAGRLLFSARNKGMRNRGTGEHVVCLRPVFAGERVLPEATVEVWYSIDTGGGVRFRRFNANAPDGGVLKVSYVERRARGGAAHE